LSSPITQQRDCAGGTPTAPFPISPTARPPYRPSNIACPPPGVVVRSAIGQPPLRDQEQLPQPGRAGLPQHPRQPAGAARDDVAAQDADLDAVVGAEREVQGELAVHHAPLGGIAQA
jgi:hypothetical protein